MSAEDIRLLGGSKGHWWMLDDGYCYCWALALSRDWRYLKMNTSACESRDESDQ